MREPAQGVRVVLLVSGGNGICTGGDIYMAGGGVPLHFGAQRGGQDADGHQCASGLQQNAVGYVQGTAVRFQVQSAGGCGQVQTGPPDCGATPLPGYGGVLQEGLGHWAQG